MEAATPGRPECDNTQAVATWEKENDLSDMAEGDEEKDRKFSDEDCTDGTASQDGRVGQPTPMPVTLADTAVC